MVSTRELPDGTLVGRAKGCLIVPGLVLRFTGPTSRRTLDVFVCFQCGQVGFAENPRVVYRKGRRVHLPKRLEIRDLQNDLELLEAAVDAFPDDQDFQKLLARRTK
jgi:hypothetical protein